VEQDETRVNIERCDARRKVAEGGAMTVVAHSERRREFRIILCAAATLRVPKELNIEAENCFTQRRQVAKDGNQVGLAVLAVESGFCAAASHAAFLLRSSLPEFHIAFFPSVKKPRAFEARS